MKIGLSIVLALFAIEVSAVTITGTLVAVHQGDTFTIKSIPPEEKLYKIRLSDIDTPEPKQPFGLNAKARYFAVFDSASELKNILDDSNSIIVKGDNKIYIDNAIEKIVKIYNDKKTMKKISSLASKKLKKISYYTNTISKNINEIYSIN